MIANIICILLYILGARVFAETLELSFTKFWHVVLILLWPTLVIISIFIPDQEDE